MKKLLSFLFCVCLLLTVTACSGGTTDSESAGTVAPESSQPDASQQPESEPDESTSPSENEPEQSADEGETALGGSTAQNDPDNAKENVIKWLSDNGYIQ